MPTLLIFILVFAVLVIAHEGGHFIASRLGGVEVDEFGLGLPPRFLTFWRNKGTIKIGDTLLRIPRNFELPFDWYSGMHRQVVATYDNTDDGPVLRTIQMADQEPPKDAPQTPEGPDASPSSLQDLGNSAGEQALARTSCGASSPTCTRARPTP